MIDRLNVAEGAVEVRLRSRNLDSAPHGALVFQCVSNNNRYAEQCHFTCAMQSTCSEFLVLRREMSPKHCVHVA